MQFPEKTEKLVILNLPHPKGLARELANNPQQQKNSQYARNFQKDEAASQVTPELLTFWVKDPEARKQYLEAFKRSSVEGMLNYYKANYPREPYADVALPLVQAPVLCISALRAPAWAPSRWASCVLKSTSYSSSCQTESRYWGMSGSPRSDVGRGRVSRGSGGRAAGR